MEGFAARLQSLIGEGSVSAFARKVGLSEALIRKYLKGAEPGLGKANQIAMGPTARWSGSPPVAGISIVRPRWWTGTRWRRRGRWCRRPVRESPCRTRSNW